MIYSLNARDNVKLQMLKQTVGLSAKEMFEIINDDFSVMKSVLIEKGITYEKLRSVLNAPHKSNRKEIVLCFNIAKIEEC